jgi:hypothetical protein
MSVDGVPVVGFQSRDTTSPNSKCFFFPTVDRVGLLAILTEVTSTSWLRSTYLRKMELYDVDVH